MNEWNDAVGTELLRDELPGHLRELQESLAGDSSPDLSAIERGVRRNRLRRVAAVAAVAAVAVAVVVLGGSAVTVGRAWFDQSQVQPGRTDRPMLEGPVRGSLASDRAWLTGFTRWAAELDEPDVLRALSRPDKWQVLYAGDVGPYRVAAVSGTFRYDNRVDTFVVWAHGPRGAAPNAMRRAGVQASGMIAFTSLAPDCQCGVTNGPPTILVVAPPRFTGLKVRLAPVYQADGSAAHPVEDLPVDETGVAVWTTSITRGIGAVELVIPPGVGPGPALHSQGEDWGVGLTDMGAMDDAGIGRAVERSGRGSGVPDRVAGAMVSMLGIHAQIGPLTMPARVEWAGRFPGDPRQAVVVVMRAPSGASLIAAGYADEDGTVTNEVRFVRKAGRPASFAWQGDNGRPSYRRWDLGIVGPSTATTARVLDRQGKELARVALTDGGGLASAPTAHRVELRDAAGALLTTLDVIPWDMDGMVKQLRVR